MKERLAKLIDVKSIVTIILTGVFAFLSVTGRISGEQFLTIFATVIAFYFGTQSAKNQAAQSAATAEDPWEAPDTTNRIGFSAEGGEAE